MVLTAPRPGYCATCWVPYPAGAPITRTARRRRFAHVDCQAPEVMALVVNTRKEAA